MACEKHRQVEKRADNPAFNCGATEVCTDHDPTTPPNRCPQSSREFKSDIHYVDSAELERLHDETLHLRLATYHYKPQYADPNPGHLGFIIEDDPGNPSVDPAHQRVDLYGYLSMVVATMKVQEKEIADLRRELAEAREEGSLSMRGMPHVPRSTFVRLRRTFWCGWGST